MSSGRGALFACGLSLLALGGCASIGPAVVQRDRTDYLSAVSESWKQQTLLNVVRMRYGDAPSFLDVSSVVTSYALLAQANAGATFSSDLTSAIPRNTASVGAGVIYQDRPTISYTPLSGDKFTKSLLRPIPPIAIFQLVQAGYPADFVLQVTVRSINGVGNRVTSGGQSFPPHPRFYPLLDALRRLQLSGAVSLRLEKRNGEEVGSLVMSSALTPVVREDLQFVIDTLGVRPDAEGELTIAYGAVQRSASEFAVLSRSMAEILIELGAGIDVPAEHIAQRRALPSGRTDSAPEPRDRPLVRILSGPAPPSAAFAATAYRDTWYWIDDQDFASKRGFTFLMFFFSLAETGVPAQAPTLTLPVN